MPAKVVVISTGGTIAMRFDAEKGGVVPAVNGRELVQAVESVTDVCPLEVVDFSNIPSFHITPEFMLRLAVETETILVREDVAGVVITHGTDTLEESAYFIDLYLAPEKPVCLTAAMRNSTDVSPDGPHNLLCAIRAAASPKLRGHGALVVINSEIHAARTVTKTHKDNVHAFASPAWGPVGYVDSDRIITRCAPKRREPLRPKNPAWNIPLLKMYTGMDTALFDALLATGTNFDGLVIEGYGRGNVPAAIVPGIKRMLEQGIPVVAASRVQAGRTLGVYAVEGGTEHLRTLGVIMSGDLSSQKARLKLMLALGLTRDLKALAAYFEEFN